jgi:APA family basic amino acid/polyamine antiporter
VAFNDIRGAIGFSSFAVLSYYAVTNRSALTLREDEERPPRIVPVVGLLGWLALAVFMPTQSIVAGVLVSVIGIVYYDTREGLARKSWSTHFNV